MVTALFFIGPAFATQRSLLSTLEGSLGWIPAFGIRICCIIFLVLWIAQMLASEMNWLWETLRGNIAAATVKPFAVVILAFLFITGCQGLRTTAKLALFTNKLGISILIAALLRVHVGWPEILRGFAPPIDRPLAADIWHGFSLLSFYVAPLALLAANYTSRIEDRTRVTKIALMGLALPLFGTLLLVGMIEVATFASPYYRPSGTPSVAMALWGQAARSAVPGRMLVTAITVFGAIRFGLRALNESASIKSRIRWVAIGLLIGVIAWCSLHSYEILLTALELSVRCLAVAGAVLTADVLIGRRPACIRRIDWVSAMALAAGLVTPFCGRLLIMDVEEWWHPWLLPSYGVALLVCLVGRGAQKVGRVTDLPSDRTQPNLT